MQPTPKKDDSVKAGLQIEAGHIPETAEELHDLFLPHKKGQPDNDKKSVKKKSVTPASGEKKK